MERINIINKKKLLEKMLQPYKDNQPDYNDLRNKIAIETNDSIKEAYKKQMHSPYSNFSKEKGYAFLKLLDVHFCPYCNINDVYTIDCVNDNGIEENVCRPDIDHFESQKDNPEKQVDLENLVPSCLICNQRLKRDKPFTNDEYLNPYKESFDDIMEFSLILHGIDYKKEENFDITITRKNGASEKQYKKADNNIKVFKLKERYQYYKNEIIPLMNNIDIYSRSKRDEIDRIFNEKFGIPFRTILFPEENCKINSTRLGKLKRDVIKKYAKNF